MVALQQKSAERRKQGVFVVEGLRELIHCQEAGYQIETLFICPSLMNASTLPSSLSDVTTFEALTDEGWQLMLDSLCLQKAVAAAAASDSVDRAKGRPVRDCSNLIGFWQTKRFHPEVRGGSKVLGDSVDCNFTSLYYRWLTVYHVTSDEEISAVINYNIVYQVDHPMMMMPTKDNTINL